MPSTRSFAAREPRVLGLARLRIATDMILHHAVSFEEFPSHIGRTGLTLNLPGLLPRGKGGELVCCLYHRIRPRVPPLRTHKTSDRMRSDPIVVSVSVIHFSPKTYFDYSSRVEWAASRFSAGATRTGRELLIFGFTRLRMAAGVVLHGKVGIGETSLDLK